MCVGAFVARKKKVEPMMVVQPGSGRAMSGSSPVTAMDAVRRLEFEDSMDDVMRRKET